MLELLRRTKGWCCGSLVVVVEIVEVVVVVVDAVVVSVERCLVFSRLEKRNVLPVVEVGVEVIFSGSLTRIFSFVVGGR